MQGVLLAMLKMTGPAQATPLPGDVYAIWDVSGTGMGSNCAIAGYNDDPFLAYELYANANSGDPKMALLKVLMPNASAIFSQVNPGDW
jgi:hypothetical protein